MKRLLDKLKKLAAIVAREKPSLHFFGLIERDDIPDSWDLLVSADKLEPWARGSLHYIAELLKKSLTYAELGKIAQIAVLPRNHKVIAAITHKNGPGDREFPALYTSDRPEHAVVIWSEKGASKANCLSRVRWKICHLFDRWLTKEKSFAQIRMRMGEFPSRSISFYRNIHPEQTVISIVLSE